jgi:hypothetical protein
VWVFVSNSLPVAHFAVGHSIARSSAKQGHGYSWFPREVITLNEVCCYLVIDSFVNRALSCVR